MTLKKKWKQFWGTAWRVAVYYNNVDAVVVADHTLDPNQPQVRFDISLAPEALMDPKSIAKQLKASLSKHHVSTRRITLVISGTPLAAQVTRLAVHPTRIRTELESQMGRYVLFSGGHPIVTHRIIHKPAPGSDETTVFAAGIRSDVVFQWQEICKWAGLILDSVTSPILLAVDAAEHHAAVTGHSWGVVVAQDQGTLWVTALYKHHLHAILPISVAAASDPTALYAHIQRLTQGAHTDSPPVVAVDQTVVNPAMLESVVARLSGVKVMIGDGKVPLIPDDRIPGMAWRAGLERSEISKKMAIFFACYAWIVSLITLTMFFGFFLGSVFVNREINEVQKELNTMHRQFKESMVLDKSIREMKQLIVDRRKTGATKDANKVQTQFFSGLPTIMSSGIKLTVIEIGADGTVAIHGKATSSDEVFTLLKQLKSLSAREGMELQEVVQDPTSGLVVFRIQGRLKTNE